MNWLKKIFTDKNEQNYKKNLAHLQQDPYCAEQIITKKQFNVFNTIFDNYFFVGTLIEEDRQNHTKSYLLDVNLGFYYTESYNEKGEKYCYISPVNKVNNLNNHGSNRFKPNDNWYKQFCAELKDAKKYKKNDYRIVKIDYKNKILIVKE
jgi:hypothetical protein